MITQISCSLTALLYFPFISFCLLFLRPSSFHLPLSSFAFFTWRGLVRPRSPFFNLFLVWPSPAHSPTAPLQGLRYQRARRAAPRPVLPRGFGGDGGRVSRLLRSRNVSTLTLKKHQHYQVTASAHSLYFSFYTSFIDAFPFSSSVLQSSL